MNQSISQELKKALDRIDRPSAFCTHGSVPIVLPGLTVKGLGTIALPLSASQARELKAHCTQAAYGKGTETVVDTAVRKVWHLTPSGFALTNPAWGAFLQDVLGIVQEELGLQKLEAHLYDLLLYEKGSFFLPHKDGEKLDRMVGTLVIVLPAEHEGGELVVRHDGREEVIDFADAANDPFEIQIAAFYADCEHEVRPLRAGHRLCLVYNLTLAKGKNAIKAPRSSERVEDVRTIFEKWADQPDAGKLVITLDHEYTEQGIKWDALKGADRAVAEVLAEAAEKVGCRAYLGLLTYHEMGSGHSAHDDYGYRGRRYYDDDDEGEDEAGPGEYFMDEVIEESLSAEHCKDRAGKPMPFAELSIAEEELLDPEALRGVEPEEEFEGYTGNAGMTLDRWYRHAAIVLWPEKSHFDVVCDQNLTAGIEMLTALCGKWRKASKKAAPALRAPCLELARAVINHWRDVAYAYGHAEKAAPDPFFPLLAELDDADLIDAYLGELMVKDVTLDPGKPLAKVCGAQGWPTYSPHLLKLFKATTAPSLPRNIRVLEHLAVAYPGDGETCAAWSRLCGSLAHEVVSALERIDLAKGVTDWRLRDVKRQAIVPGLLRALIAGKQSQELARLTQHMLAQPEHYPLADLLTALKELQPWLEKHVRTADAGLAQMLSSCRQQLEKQTAQVPQAPTDQRRPASAKCKCADCQALNRFLADPRESVYRFKAAQHRRSHVENAIRVGPCDVDCKTERTSSPQTLVCSKNTKSYEAALKKYHADLKHLGMVQAIETSAGFAGIMKHRH